MPEGLAEYNRKLAKWLGAMFFLCLVAAAVLNFQLRGGTEARRMGLPEFDFIGRNLQTVDFTLQIMLSIFASIGAIFVIEAVAVGWKGSSLRALLWPRSKSPWYDVVIYGLIQAGYFNTLILWFSFGLPLFSVIFWDSVGLNFLPATARFSTRNVFYDVAIYYFVFTFFDYWNHRLFHSSRLWNLHRMHHSAKEFTILTAARNHPAAMAVEPFIRNWPMFLIGLSPQGIGLFNLITTPYFHLIHSRVDWDLGWVGRWILISPQGHKIHHSDQPEHRDKNLSICPLWDRLFGTWYDGEKINSTIGLIDGDYETNNIAREWFLDSKALLWSFVRAENKP